MPATPAVSRVARRPVDISKYDWGALMKYGKEQNVPQGRPFMKALQSKVVLSYTEAYTQHEELVIKEGFDATPEGRRSSPWLRWAYRVVQVKMGGGAEAEEAGSADGLQHAPAPPSPAESRFSFEDGPVVTDRRDDEVESVSEPEAFRQYGGSSGSGGANPVTPPQMPASVSAGVEGGVGRRAGGSGDGRV